MLVLAAGCGRTTPSATVEGVLRFQGVPLDNCVVRFLPEPNSEVAMRGSAGMTDAEGRYQLRFDDQRPGAAIGWHRVIVQDLNVSTGVMRRDHGTVDEQPDETPAAAAVRPSRIPREYTFVEQTPWRIEVKAGHQAIDLDSP